jgi:hypothetical protein
MASMLRDSGLIDALEATSNVAYEGTLWRVVREGRDPCQCSAPGGRWDDGTFDVLYTSLERNGAIAEMHFHLMRGQPVFPSKVRYTLHELHVSVSEVKRIEALQNLAALGLDTSKYGQLAYQSRVQEYPRSQQIAEVSHFLDCKALMVPNARWSCLNLVLFCDGLQPDALQEVKNHGVIDWAQWQRDNARAV